MAESNQVVTRFAPSPTGYLHIGGARTALFNWAFARRHGGQFILRIEDTDRARSTPEATRRIIEDLQWLGLDWDQGPDPAAKDLYAASTQMGDREPYFQSQRGELYRQYLQQLIDAGRAYPENGAYRFKMPEKDITVPDAVLGDVTIKREQLEDFIIFKGEAAGGGPTFHFANVVDDATMGVTHVLRAQEHLMNTPKHVALFEALGLEHPRYAHMPLIFNPDGTKMSKRDKAKAARKAGQDWLAKNGRDKVAQLAEAAGIEAAALQQFMDKKSDDTEVAAKLGVHLQVALPEIDVHDFRVSGYLPEVILNYIALLGWSPGKDVERFDLQFLVDHFELDRIGKSNARFDRAKLLAFNGEAIAKLTLDEFVRRWREHLAAYHPEFLARFDDASLRLLAQAYQLRSPTLDEPVHKARFFVVADDAVEFDAKAVQKVLHKNEGAGLRVLGQLRSALSESDHWEPASLHSWIESFSQQRGLGMGDVAQPLRVALTGTAVSPPINETLAIMGKSSTLARIDRCLRVHAG